MICDIDIWEKCRRFGKCFQAKGSSVTHLPYYILCIRNTLGRSIVSISNFGGIFILALVNMPPRVIYISAIDLPTILYIT